MSSRFFSLVISMVMVYLVTDSVAAHEFWFDGSPHGQLESIPSALMANFLQMVKFNAMVMDKHFYDFYCK